MGKKLGESGVDFPRTLPPYGYCAPCHCLRFRDGDTVVVQGVFGLPVPVRLIDCWAPEESEPGGEEASLYAQAALEEADSLSVWIPFPKRTVRKARKKEAVNPLSLATFDRWPGYIFLRCDETLNEKMVQAGLAFRTKQELNDWKARQTGEKHGA